VRCGIYTYSRDLVEALASQGINTYVIRLHRLGEKGQEYYEHLASRRIPKGLDIIHVQEEYGLYNNFEHVFFPLLKDLNEPPVITTMHATGVKRRADAVIGEMSDLVIVHNEFCRDKFASKEEPLIIPHGVVPRKTVPSDEAKEELGLEGPTAGVFGFQSPNKRLEDFLLACKQLEDVTPVIAGGSLMDVETDYMQRLKRLGGEEVEWLGYVPDEEMPTVMGALDVCTHTSSYVSESGAILTMIGYGKAVVARDLPPNAEKPCLELFEDVDGLAEKIRYLVENPSEREKLERKAREYAEETSWPKIAERHKTKYKEVLKRRVISCPRMS